MKKIFHSTLELLQNFVLLGVPLNPCSLMNYFNVMDGTPNTEEAQPSFACIF